MEKKNLLNNLASFCKLESSAKTRIALATFYDGKYPQWFEISLLLIEHLQLISQALLLQSSVYDDPSTDNTFIFNVIIYFFKLINPSYLLSFSQYNFVISFIFVLVLCCMVLKYLLFTYIVVTATLKWKRSYYLETIWKLTYKLQGRALCFFMTSFWLRMILTSSNEGFGMFGMSKEGNIILASVMFGLECLFSLILETQFYYVLPTKSLLSSKNNYILMITLCQKVIIQVIEICFRSESSSLRLAWVNDILNLVFSSLRCFEYFTRLPLYNPQTLVYQGNLISLVASLHISCFFRTMLKAANQDGADINFTIIVWIVLGVLAVKVSSEFLRRRLTSLILGKSFNASELFMHNLIFIKELRKSEAIPGTKSEEYDFKHLLTTLADATTKAKIKSKQGSSVVKLSAITKGIERKMQLEELDNLAAKSPKDEFLQLYIAYIRSKDRTLYPRAIKITVELSKTKWSLCHLTASVLLSRIQKLIVDNYGNMKERLDLFAYLRSQIFVEELRSEMLQQTELKMKICQNITGDISDIGEISNCAHLIDASKTRVQKKINLQLQDVPIGFMEPLRLYAEYSLMLNYSVEDYEKYYDLYLQRNAKYAKHFKNTQLNKDNLFQSTNVFLLVQGQKGDNGRILYCTKQIESVCGGDKALYFGSNITSLFLPSLQSYYTHFFKDALEAGNNTLLHKVFKAYLYHKDRYIVETEFYLRVHPYVSGYYDYNMLIRPVPSTKEFILVKEDGDIEGASQKLSNALGIKTVLQSSSTKSISIRALSEELEKVNKAFNLVHKEKVVPNLSLAANEKQTSDKSTHSPNLDFSMNPNNSKLLELYTDYNSEGRLIELFPLNKSPKNDSRGYFYHCTVSVLTYGSTFLKLISLEAVLKEEKPEIHGGVHQKPKPERLTTDVEKLNDSNIGGRQSENFDCQEREPGDSPMIPIIPTIEWKRDTLVNTDASPLASPNGPYRSQRSPLLSPTSGRLIPSGALQNSTLMLHINSLTTFKESSKEKVEKKPQALSHLSSHGTSVNTTERTSNRAIQSAINRKTYPSFFYGVCFVVYAFILITLIGQIILKSRIDVTMDDLIQKNDMLNYAQDRLYRAIAVEIVSFALAVQVEVGTTTNNIENINLGFTNMVELLNSHTNELINDHNEIIEGLVDIDTKIKEALFEPNIRLNGSYLDSSETSYKKVTSFQLVDEIIAAVRMVYAMPDRWTSEAGQVFSFIANNILNDFLSEQLIVIDLFLDSVNKGKQDLRYIIILCLIIPVSFALIVFMLVLLIWRVYTIEKTYMLAFISLTTNRIQGVHSDLKDYKRNLINEEYFQKKELTYFVRKLDIPPQETEDGKSRKASSNRTINYSSTRKRYYGYIFKIIFYSAMVLAIMIWNVIAAQSSTDDIYSRQSQSDFVNYITIRVPLYYATFYVLFISDNTELVNHTLPLNVMLEGLDDMKNVQNEIHKVFMEKDGTYDPQLKAFIFDNTGCSRFTGQHYGYCTAVASEDQPTYLLSTMSLYDQLLNEKVQAYYSVQDANSSVLLVTAEINVIDLIAYYDLITTDVLSMSQIIVENLSQSVNDAYNERVLILVISSFLIGIAGILFWFRVLTQLREVNNNFKKVLQVYPPNLIRSSFLLKKFLRKASGLAPIV